jgi:hypothetical protein
VKKEQAMVRTREMNEAQMVGLVRNALLVAGEEMGENGEHWPVVNATIHSIAKDWEESRLEDAADEEMKGHLYQKLENMEKGLADCSPELRTELAPKLKELREAYDAYFSPIDEKAALIHEDEVPIHIKRAEAIIATLGGDEHV